MEMNVRRAKIMGSIDQGENENDTTSNHSR